jgi:spermidine/putrescine transport system ATP-binding protein
VNEPAVRLVGLHKRFGGFVAVQPLNLEIPSGTFFSIIGPSGCGKTTTLRMIAGLETPTEGRIEVSGRDITRVPAYRRPVNTVFQSYALFPHLDVFENVAFGLREDRRPKQEIAGRVQKILGLVSLEGRERSSPRQLSGGEQQRVALARALVKEPDVLLLDEPLGALDLKLRRQLQEELREVQQRVGITFIYVTHDQEEAFSMSAGTAVMDHGVLEQIGDPETIYRRPASVFVADFVGLSNRFPGHVIAAAVSGRFTVELEPGTRVQAAGPEGVAEGAPVSVIVRPEELRIAASTGDGGDEDDLRARVSTITYLGASRQLRLDSERYGDLVAVVQGALHPAREGDRVTVTWDPDAAWIVPERPA